MGEGASLDGMVARAPQQWARLAGFFYLVNTVTSLSSFSGKLGGAVLTWTNGTATAAYVAVVILLYLLLRPDSHGLSAVAAVFGLIGCADEALLKYNLFPVHVHSLVFFGFYCTLLGVLILRSEFMPRFPGWTAAAGRGRLADVCVGEFVEDVLAIQLHCRRGGRDSAHAVAADCGRERGAVAKAGGGSAMRGDRPLVRGISSRFIP